MGDSASKAAELEREVDPLLGEDPKGDGSLRPPSKRPANGTLLIFDWDDTLLCSTAAAAGSPTPEQLRQLQQTAASLLRLSQSLGETMIVTNGNATWVQDSSRRFLPGLVSTLEDIEVVSARAHCENMYPGDPFAWKRECFRELLGRRSVQAQGVPPVNLVVLGDSPAEMEAAHQATKVIGDAVLVKTVKFREAPTVQQLIGQLNKMHQDLRGIVNATVPLSKRLEPRKLPPNLTNVASWASSWRLIPGKEWGQQLPFVGPVFTSSDECTSASEYPTWVFMLGDKIASLTKGMALKY